MALSKTPGGFRVSGDSCLFPDVGSSHEAGVLLFMGQWFLPQPLLSGAWSRGHRHFPPIVPQKAPGLLQGISQKKLAVWSPVALDRFEAPAFRG